MSVCPASTVTGHAPRHRTHTASRYSARLSLTRRTEKGRRVQWDRRQGEGFCVSRPHVVRSCRVSGPKVPSNIFSLACWDPFFKP